MGSWDDKGSGPDFWITQDKCDNGGYWSHGTIPSPGKNKEIFGKKNSAFTIRKNLAPMFHQPPWKLFFFFFFHQYKSSNPCIRCLTNWFTKFGTKEKHHVIVVVIAYRCRSCGYCCDPEDWERFELGLLMTTRCFDISSCEIKRTKYHSVIEVVPLTLDSWLGFSL